MKVDVHKATPADLSRIAELSQRTNKCTNGKRYTVDQLVEKLENGYMLYSVAVSDKFSSLGLVGAIGVEENTLDLFTLSCRALGRNIEEMMIDFFIVCLLMNYSPITVKRNFLWRCLVVSKSIRNTLPNEPRSAAPSSTAIVSLRPISCERKCASVLWHPRASSS